MFRPAAMREIVCGDSGQEKIGRCKDSLPGVRQRNGQRKRHACRRAAFLQTGDFMDAAVQRDTLLPWADGDPADKGRFRLIAGDLRSASDGQGAEDLIHRALITGGVLGLADLL